MSAQGKGKVAQFYRLLSLSAEDQALALYCPVCGWSIFPNHKSGDVTVTHCGKTAVYIDNFRKRINLPQAKMLSGKGVIENGRSL